MVPGLFAQDRETTPGAPAAARTVFTGVMLLDPSGGRRTPAPVLVVGGGRIVEIRAGEAGQNSQADLVIAADGGTAVPGLLDVGLDLHPTRRFESDYFARLSLAYGITHALVPAPRPLWGADQKRRAARGDTVSPALELAAPMLVSERPPVGDGGLEAAIPHRLVTTPAEAVQAVEAAVKDGYDWIRLSSALPRPVAQAAISAARARKRRVAVVAAATPVEEMVSLAPDLIEGLGTVTKASLGAVKRLAAGRVVLAPQLARVMGPGQVDALDQQRDAALELVPASVRAAVRAAMPAGGPARPTPAMLLQASFVSAWVEAGGALVVSTGASPTGWPVPGVAASHELLLWQEAGVPAKGVFAALALGANRLRGASARPWAPKAAADFFIVDGDPLADIGALAKVVHVVRNGERLDPKHLLAEARRAVSSTAR